MATEQKSAPVYKQAAALAEVIDATTRLEKLLGEPSPQSAADLIRALHEVVVPGRFSQAEFYRGLVAVQNSREYHPDSFRRSDIPQTGTISYAGFSLDIDNNQLVTPEKYRTKLYRNRKGADQLTFMAALMVMKGRMLHYPNIQRELLEIPGEYEDYYRELIVSRVSRLGKVIKDPILEEPKHGVPLVRKHLQLVPGVGVYLV